MIAKAKKKVAKKKTTSRKPNKIKINRFAVIENKCKNFHGFFKSMEDACRLIVKECEPALQAQSSTTSDLYYGYRMFSPVYTGKDYKEFTILDTHTGEQHRLRDKETTYKTIKI